MELAIDRLSAEPIYRQIARQIGERIAAGVLEPGFRLPAERQLAGQLRVQRSTVTWAYRELQADGLIEARQGSGAYVRRREAAAGAADWRPFVEAGGFRPAQPILRRLRDMALAERFINFADGELEPALMPNESLENVLGGLKLDRWLGYSDHRGEPYFREAIAGIVMRKQAIRAEPEKVLVTSGAQQALHLLTVCLLGRGDGVGLESPSYHYSLPLFSSAGIRLVRLPADESGPIPEALPKLHAEQKLRMLIVSPTYHNPTGAVMPLERRMRLLDACRAHGIAVVEDDAYGAIRLEGAPEPPPPLYELAGGRGNVLYIGSMSKMIAPGLRIGWLAGPLQVVERLADAKQSLDFGTSTLLQQAMDAFVRSGEWERHTLRIRAALTRKRDRMLSALERHAGRLASRTEPPGGYHVWCGLPGGVSERLVFERAAKKGVMLVPGTVYGADPGYVRLSYARPTEDEIERGIAVLGEVLEGCAAGRYGSE